MTKPKVSDVRIQKSLFYNVHPLLLLLMLTKICHVHETLLAETETKTEMLSLETETRPRRDVGRSRDRLETRHPRPRPCTSLHDNLINTKYAY